VYTVAAEEMGNVVSEELYNLSTTGNEEKIKKLLIANRGRLHINWKNPLKHYRTALHAATRHCHLNIVKLLLQWKAKTNIRDSFGWCPLDYACLKGYLDIVDVLTDHPNWTGSAGRTIYNETSLHIACRYEHVAVVRLLLQKGAKVYVNARSSGRNTPLHFAVLKQNTEIVRMLLANGASHHIVNMNTFTPLQIANAQHYKEGISLMNQASKTNMPYIEDDGDLGAYPQDGNPTEFLLADSEPIEVQSVKCFISDFNQSESSSFMSKLNIPYQQSDKLSMTVFPLDKHNSSSSLDDFREESEQDESIGEVLFKDSFEDLRAKFGFIDDAAFKNAATQSLFIINVGNRQQMYEILTLILQGPALHFFVLNLSNDFISTSAAPNTLQVLFHQLSNASRQLKHDGKAVLFGMQDRLDAGDLRWDKERKLAMHFSNADHTTKEFVLPVKQSYIYYVNRTKKTSELNREFVSFVKKVVNNHFQSKKIPLKWHLFHIVLQNKFKNSEGICCLEDCFQIADDIGISRDVVPDILRYFHDHLSSVLHFEAVQSLNDIIICHPNILLSMIDRVVSILLNNTELQRTGEIPNLIMNEVNQVVLNSKMKGYHIMKLLKHYNALIEMAPGRYFMPLLLSTDSRVLTITTKQIINRPLLVHIEAPHTTSQLFSALFVKLSQKWHCHTTFRYRNHIRFSLRGSSTVSLIFYVDHFEVHVKGDNPPYQYICNVLKESLSGIYISSEVVQFSFGFYCPGDISHPHFCCYIESSDSIICSKFPNRCQGYHKPFALPQEYEVWFKGKEQITDGSSPTPSPVPRKIPKEDKDDIRSLRKRINELETELADKMLESELLQEALFQAQNTSNMAVTPKCNLQLMTTARISKRDRENCKEYTIISAFVVLFVSLMIFSLLHKSPSIRPSNVIASTRMLALGGRPSQLNWDRYGLRLMIPHNALPPGVMAEIKIYVTLSGPYIYPDSNQWRLAGPVYWLSSTKNFLTPIELGIYHNLKGEVVNSSVLRMIVANDEPQNRQYKFQYVNESYYVNGSYCYISINHFSAYSTLSSTENANFHGSLLYRKSPKSNFTWEYSFIVHKLYPVGIIDKQLNRAKYTNWIYDISDVSVEFLHNADVLTLNFDNDSTQHGWKIKERTSPLMYRKSQLLYADDILSNMQFYLIWTKREEQPTTIFIDGILHGAEQPKVITFISNNDQTNEDNKVVLGTNGGSIHHSEDLLAHVKSVHKFIIFCHYLGIDDNDCYMIEKDRPDNIEEQKLVALRMWQEMKERSWKEFIVVLAKVDCCRKAKELAVEHNVEFDDDSDDASLANHHCFSFH
jgi:hypothetical protein